MDMLAEARRLASIATVFVWVGWYTVIYAIIAGIFWWIDLAQRAAINWFEALGASLSAIGGPIFLVSTADEALHGGSATGCGAAAVVRKQDLRPSVLEELWAAHGTGSATT